MNKRSFLSLFFLVISYCSKGQQQLIYPEQFLSFVSPYLFSNPCVPQEEPMSVDLVFNKYPGLSKNVGFYYLSLSVKKQTAKKTHTFGLHSFSEQETDLLSRTYIALRYAWSTSLNEKVKLSGGASFGLFNYFIGATNSSVGGSYFKQINTIGLWLKGPKYDFGLSLKEYINQTNQLENTNFYLMKSLNVMLHYKLFSQPQYDLTIAMDNSIIEKDFFSIRTSLEYLYLKKLSVGILSNTRKGFGFNVGIRNYEIGKNKLDLVFSYVNNSWRLAQSQTYLSNEQLEIQLAYKIFSKKNREILE